MSMLLILMCGKPVFNNSLPLHIWCIAFLCVPQVDNLHGSSQEKYLKVIKIKRNRILDLHKKYPKK